MKRKILSWEQFKKEHKSVPIEKGKVTAPENSKIKSGKSEGGAGTLEKAKKHDIPTDKKGKKGEIKKVLDDPKKITIKDDSQLKKAEKVKDILETPNKKK